MPTGLAYLREVGMKVVNDEILQLAIPTITEQIDQGQVSISNTYIAKYWAPTDYSLDLSGPDSFTWTLSKMHIRAVGEFEARLNSPLLIPTVPLKGEFETLLGHISLSISVRLFRSPYGSPQVQSTKCASQVGYVDLNVRNTGVITDFFINSFKGFLISHFKPTVEQRMCQMIEKVINIDMNSILSTMPLKVRINENDLDIIGQTFDKTRKPFQKLRLNSHSLKNGSLINFINDLRDKNLVLDYSIMRNPFINHGTITMVGKGEISYKGMGGTPFYPPNIEIPQPHGVHMLEFYGTDFVANSMLYHAYRQKYMDMIVGPESNLKLKEILLTTCKSGFCIGEFLGDLSTQYPGREIEIKFTARKAPILVFVSNRARFRLHGRMNMYLRPNNTTQMKTLIIRSDTTMTANVYLQIIKSKITGNATIENLDFKLIESKISNVDQSVFQDLGLFGAEFVEKLISEILEMGMLMPTMKGIVLKSPKLSIHDRYVKVQTYFKLDEHYAGSLIQGAVKQSLRNVG
ncbi:Lipid-binding serum glycoprotein, C-terminal domain and Lipid-binding serum glycoprotein, N-terminal domain and Bactericidal permeability-increasing protein, alpha/beta domain-containing protein [Strongyloides ratti]|uniref:Lipid-binding serum glycoprotein, C-terminal domain and Lipid-binding serum glycoprotein, N-terminal domain and Bactericidal permeability-increasing protein, alpha/beta domain-containing protein n=1 Tax=Strongyloides ratti TaxID=34506 RepID=A0A090LT88_STRRB|nr:Lipid-binding serum glycoprotein, C-terminal domain and Lipid-binding serum glycoprotein, N-terminal domain and Bactericidal permeability-increasing protein, alpha/beta domain-containing protein [Strongyloides ratti]CEF70819.1 Lipid-binding serum glycoprotein, C-terminal domain and Lipid-binding serum glycoprotein, N-terminal domain and Bactericidal permeability-increasing protein, alpha/beta domain-containing protein [Strongyloides ratti]